MIALSIAGIALLANKVGASLAAVPLSAVLLFNQSFYWGFLPFMAGFIAFLFLIISWLEPRQFSWQKLVIQALLFMLVYFSHILWFVVTLLTVPVLILASPGRIAKFRALSFSALPAITLALSWYPSLHNKWAGKGFDMSPYWIVPLHDRLHPLYAANAIYGLKADFKLFILLTVVLFILGGILRSITGKQKIISVPLLVLALIVLTAYLAMPDQYNNTILFAARWLPYVFIFLLLGCLAPLQAQKWSIGVLYFAFAVLGAHTLLTASSWLKMEKEDLSGLQQAMEKLPAKQRVLGLDILQTSPTINTLRPFLAIHAYTQVLKGCETNFSFAEHASSLVTYKTTPLKPFQIGLEWAPERVSMNDVYYFDYVLANADDEAHGKLASYLKIRPVTYEGRWRLYSVRQAD
ncbi:MAG: hypothetical protein OEV35_04785 [Gallionellaceae bacterium]|nr:hypothetical protein [Gallionellaceae bacterium]